MSTSHYRLSELFRRYYYGQATTQETDELMTLIRAAKDDEQLSGLLRAAWHDLQEADRLFSPDAGSRILDKILDPVLTAEDTPGSTGKETGGLQKYFSGWRYAAAAVIILTGFWIARKWDFKPGTSVNRQVTQVDIPPGGNKAVLTLEDGSVIPLDDAGTGVLARQGETEINKTGDGHLVYHASGTSGTKPAAMYNTVSTPRGGQYRITLPDGSKVWLNASSSVRFPAVFPSGERTVEIRGEVYFEVEKAPSQPFKVRFGDHEVNVLGTRFNIMHYDDERSSQTTLVEGSVALKTGGKTSRLEPGEQARIIENGNVSILHVDTEEVTAWKDGLFFFQDAGIESIMRQAARWYDIEVIYEGPLPVRQFSGKVSRDVNLSELMNMLHYLGVNYRVEGKKVIVSH